MGTDIARAALEAGYAVVATGRNTDAVTDAIGEHDDLLVVRLDVTSADEAEAAVNAAVERFGQPRCARQQRRQLLCGVLRGAFPRAGRGAGANDPVRHDDCDAGSAADDAGQRSGQVVAISSVAGLIGQEFCSAYAAAKFGVEGFIESLATEVEQFGIGTTIVEPGFFRTDLLTPESTTWAELSVDDYAEQAAATKEAWQRMNGQQGGDPAKLARALVEIVGSDKPPARWVAGADAVEAAEGKARTLLAQVDAHRELSSSLAYDEA